MTTTNDSLERRLFAVETTVKELELGRREQIVIHREQRTIHKEQNEMLKEIKACLFGNGMEGLAEACRKNTAARRTMLWIAGSLLLTVLVGIGGIAWKMVVQYNQSNL